MTEVTYQRAFAGRVRRGPHKFGKGLDPLENWRNLALLVRLEYEFHDFDTVPGSRFEPPFQAGSDRRFDQHRVSADSSGGFDAPIGSNLDFDFNRASNPVALRNFRVFRRDLLYHFPACMLIFFRHRGASERGKYG